MKFLAKLLILFCLILGNSAIAEPFKVLVLPADLFSVCENYYCFPEVSEIVAEDVIDEFNKYGKIFAINLYDVRKKFAENPALKSSAVKVLNKYKSSEHVDFQNMKVLSKEFGANSILLISSCVNQENLKRNVWEVLEVSSAFEAISSYELHTNAVLTDNVNDIIMWSGKYTKNLGDNENRFWARSFASANSQMERLRFWSKDIVSKSISQNITLRFFPKTPRAVQPKTVKTKTETTDFRPSLGIFGPKQDNNFDDLEIDSETIYTF